VSFRIDASSGKLHPTGHATSVPTPVCVKYLAPMR
jgi:6-phosphogluconolactonase (cycloisomerase 2 family)